MKLHSVATDATKRLGKKNVILIAGLIAFTIAGVIQQKYQKAQDQKDYEAECAIRATSKVASPCVSPTRPDIPLPAQG